MYTTTFKLITFEPSLLVVFFCTRKRFLSKFHKNPKTNFEFTFIPLLKIQKFNNKRKIEIKKRNDWSLFTTVALLWSSSSSLSFYCPSQSRRWVSLLISPIVEKILHSFDRVRTSEFIRRKEKKNQNHVVSSVLQT